MCLMAAIRFKIEKEFPNRVATIPASSKKLTQYTNSAATGVFIDLLV
jgi:hypothetical protein